MPTGGPAGLAESGHPGVPVLLTACQPPAGRANIKAEGRGLGARPWDRQGQQGWQWLAGVCGGRSLWLCGPGVHGPGGAFCRAPDPTVLRPRLATPRSLPCCRVRSESSKTTRICPGSTRERDEEGTGVGRFSARSWLLPRAWPGGSGAPGRAAGRAGPATPLMAPGPPRVQEKPLKSAQGGLRAPGRPRSKWPRLRGARSADPFTAAPGGRPTAWAPSPSGGLPHRRTDGSLGSLALLKLLFKLIGEAHNFEF